MSVQVKNLTKQFGDQKAVNNISFEAKKGEILGFLGPNGAGKSTTMKIITCYYPQTAGVVEVCGINTLSDPNQVKRKIGYLPEHNPLYQNMYVKEYLKLVAGLCKVNKPNARIRDMIELTGLGKEEHKIIGTLSKGYRQRVGLAQAMLHNPEVLILDEPTSGLDPNQLIEIRKVIREIGREKTVIFSSHIMQEVQELCDRIVIINNGELVADNTIETLQKSVDSQHTIYLELDDEVNVDIRIKGIVSIEQIDKKLWKIKTDLDKDYRKDIFRYCVANELTILTLHKAQSSVEDVFKNLTRK